MPWAAKAGKPLYHLIRTRAYDSELIWLALTVQCVRRTIFQITEMGMGSTIMAGVPTATGDSWTAVDAREFSVRSQILIEQANAYDPMDNLHVNGAFTLDENIGDLGGLTIAYRAYQLSLKGKPAPVIQGFTGPQQFFLGWAQAWRRKYRDEELRQRLVTDPHLPCQYRCIGVVSTCRSFTRLSM